jgi:hypothetical protein
VASRTKQNAADRRRAEDERVERVRRLNLARLHRHREKKRLAALNAMRAEDDIEIEVGQ